MVSLSQTPTTLRTFVAEQDTAVPDLAKKLIEGFKKYLLFADILFLLVLAAVSYAFSKSGTNISGWLFMIVIIRCMFKLVVWWRFDGGATIFHKNKEKGAVEKLQEEVATLGSNLSQTESAIHKIKEEILEIKLGTPSKSVLSQINQIREDLGEPLPQTFVTPARKRKKDD